MGRFVDVQPNQDELVLGMAFIPVKLDLQNVIRIQIMLANYIIIKSLFRRQQIFSQKHQQ